MQDLVSEVQREFVKRQEAELKKAYEKVFGEPFDMNKADFSAFTRHIYLGKEYYTYKDRCFFIVEQEMKMVKSDEGYTIKRDGYVPNRPLYVFIKDGKIQIEYKD